MFEKLREKLGDMLWVANPKNHIWPPTNNDPSIKGPQPRIISTETALAFRRLQREAEKDKKTAASQDD